MSIIRETQNYAYEDILGKGATSVVYKGINKTTGDYVAIKTFLFSYKTQELEVLKRLNHENIVKLLAIERDLNSTDLVLVTELCTGGCLNDILNEPEHMYGLNDSEFLLFLSHLYAGMKYLRDNDIVHRDLKPGNIMRFQKSDGTWIYKLIDFGTARELPEDKDFQTFCGTEEYLAPDLYERAILGLRDNLRFPATVDLWSLGVTLYHVASGNLPFRPYGGRRNRDKSVMHFITTAKDPGVISGVQRSENGPIEWSTQLPEDSLLSKGLKRILTPLIAGLLETDNEKIWSYEKFFGAVSEILSRKLLTVFYVNEPTLLNVYVKPESYFEELAEDIFAQIGLTKENQLYMPKISDRTILEKSPIYLLSKNNRTIHFSKLETFNDTLHFTRPTNVAEDNRQARKACSIGYQVKRQIDKYCLDSKLISDFVDSLSQYIIKSFEKLNEQAENILDKIQHHNKTAAIFNISQKASGYTPKIDIKKQIKDIDNSIQSSYMIISQLYTKYKQEDFCKSYWDKLTKSVTFNHTTKSTSRAIILTQELKESMHCLLNGRQIPINPTNQYLMEKTKIRNSLHSLLNILNSKVYPQQAVLCLCLEEWHNTIEVDFTKIEILDDSLKDCQVNLEELDENISSEIKLYEEYVNEKVLLNQRLKLKLNLSKSRNKSDEIIKQNKSLISEMNDIISTFQISDTMII